MRVVRISFMAFLLLLVISGTCFGDRVLEQKLSDLNEKMATLSRMEDVLESKFEELKPDAVRMVTMANKIIAAKPHKDFTKDEKLIILTAALLVERMERIACQLGLVRWRMNKTQEEIDTTKKQLQTEKEA